MRAPSDRPLAAQLPHGKALSGRPPEQIEEVPTSPPEEPFPVGKVASEASRMGPAQDVPPAEHEKQEDEPPDQIQVIRYRLTYRKTGDAVLLGHLDI